MSDGLVPQPQGGALRRFPPGVSGNPGGRPAGLMAYVQRKAGRDGRKLADMLFALAIGTDAQRDKYFKGMEIRVRDVMRAGEILLDRGWGRPFVPEDDIPFVPQAGSAGPVLEFRIPRPAKELEGRTVVVYDDEKGAQP